MVKEAEVVDEEEDVEVVATVVVAAAMEAHRATEAMEQAVTVMVGAMEQVVDTQAMEVGKIKVMAAAVVMEQALGDGAHNLVGSHTAITHISDK